MKDRNNNEAQALIQEIMGMVQDVAKATSGMTRPPEVDIGMVLQKNTPQIDADTDTEGAAKAQSQNDVLNILNNKNTTDSQGGN